MRQLEYLVVAQLAARYRSIITQNIVKLSTLPERCNGEHLVRLCSEMIDNGRKYPWDKMNRWIGFVQGVLATQGIIDVDIEREVTRPVLHMLHKDRPPTFG